MILDIEMPSYNLRVNEQMDLSEVFLKTQAIEKIYPCSLMMI